MRSKAINSASSVIASTISGNARRCLVNANLRQQQMLLCAQRSAPDISRPTNDQKRNFSDAPRLRQAAPVSSTPASKDLPLSGYLVVSLEQAIAGPFCTRQLADLGARVIKIERPGLGDFNRYHDKRVKDQCSHFVWTNRSKESLALDLKKPEDLAALKKVLAKADVLVQNLAPGASERMGLGFETLKEKHPGLIVCDISGYGELWSLQGQEGI